MPCPACWRQDIVFEGTGECKGIRRFFTEIQIGIYRAVHEMQNAKCKVQNCH